MTNVFRMSNMKVAAAGQQQTFAGNFLAEFKSTRWSIFGHETTKLVFCSFLLDLEISYG